MHSSLPEQADDRGEAALVEGVERARCDEIVARLAELARSFERNVVAATSDWTKHVVDERALEGMPARALARARRQAEARQLDGFLLTLHERSYEAALNHLDDRQLRREIYEARVTRASDHGPRAGRFDNTALVQEILALRHELAQRLGAPTYADLAQRYGMLRAPDDVERYLLRQAAGVRARAQAELDAIWAFAKSKGVPKGFSTWDLGYYAQRLKREQPAFFAEGLRPYLALPDVLAGLLALCERLLGVRAEPLAASGDARAALLRCRLSAAEVGDLGQIEIESSSGDEPLEAAQITVSEGEDALPVLRVVCDLDPPEGGPILLDEAQLAALFRAVGQGLYALFSRAQPVAASAVRDVSATASDIAGAYFELFASDVDTLAPFARDRARGISLPRDLWDALARQRAVDAGLTEAQEIELALFDLRVHRDFVPPDKATRLRAHVLDTLGQVRREVCVLRPPFWERMANTCTAIFAEDRGARLWERRWAKQVARELFEEYRASGSSRDVARQQREAFWIERGRGLIERLTGALGRRPAPLP